LSVIHSRRQEHQVKIKNREKEREREQVNVFANENNRLLCQKGKNVNM
jgi:hypothetical protein